MKIIAIASSYRKNGVGSKILDVISDRLHNYSLKLEIIYLSDFKIEFCRGCKICYKKGEEFCPLKDDVSILRNKMLNSDGVIFLTPTYVISMSGNMKTLLDRISYYCHRGQFTGKFSLVISNTAAGGEKMVLTPLAYAVMSMGFKITDKKGFKIPFDVISAYQKREIEVIVDKFYNTIKKGVVKPDIIEVMSFLMRKQAFSEQHPDTVFEHNYWKENGLLKKNVNYFNNIQIPFVKLVLAKILKKIIYLFF